MEGTGPGLETDHEDFLCRIDEFYENIHDGTVSDEDRVHHFEVRKAVNRLRSRAECSRCKMLLEERWDRMLPPLPPPPAQTPPSITSDESSVEDRLGRDAQLAVTNNPVESAAGMGNIAYFRPTAARREFPRLLTHHACLFGSFAYMTGLLCSVELHACGCKGLRQRTLHDAVLRCALRAGRTKRPLCTAQRNTSGCRWPEAPRPILAGCNTGYHLDESNKCVM